MRTEARPDTEEKIEKSYPLMDPLLLLVDALAALPPSNITPSHLRILLQQCPPFQRRGSAGSTSPLQVPHGAFRDPHFLYVKPPSVTQLEGLVSVAQFLAKSGGLYHNELLTPVLDFLQAMIPLSNQYPSAPIFSSPSLSPFLSAILSLLSELATSCPETRPEISASVATSVLQVTEDRRVGSDDNGIQGRRDHKSATDAGCELLSALGERCPLLEPEHALAVVESLQRYWKGLPNNLNGKSTVTGPSRISQSVEGDIEAPPQLVEKLLNVNWQGGEAEESSNRAGNGISLEGEGNGHLEEANGEVPGGIEEVEGVSVDGDMEDALSAFDSFSLRRSAADSCRDLSQFQTPNQFLTSGQSPGSMAMLRPDQRLEGKQVAFRIMAQVLGEGAGSNLEEHPIKNQYLAAARQQLKDTQDLLQMRVDVKSTAGLPSLSRVVGMLEAATAGVTLLAAAAPGPAVKSGVSEELLEVVATCLQSALRKVAACERLLSVAVVSATRNADASILLLLRPLLTTAALQDLSLRKANPSAPSLPSLLCLEAACATLVKEGLKSSPAAIESFLTTLAMSQVVSTEREALVPVLTRLVVALDEAGVVQRVFPLVSGSLGREGEGEGMAACPLRAEVLEGVGWMGGVGGGAVYREAVGILCREYGTAVKNYRESVSEGGREELQKVLPTALLILACHLTPPALRSDLRQRLLALCSNVGLVTEARSFRSGPTALGCLLPAVAESLTDFCPLSAVPAPLVKLFRNLWFYISLYNLAPLLPERGGGGKEYPWKKEWATAVTKIAEATPPLVMGATQWVEEDMELNALHNPGSVRGSTNEGGDMQQRQALVEWMGGKVGLSSLSSMSGVKATYLRSVAVLESLRVAGNGGKVRGEEGGSALQCSFAYLRQRSLAPPVIRCLAAIVERVCDATWQALSTPLQTAGQVAEQREALLATHATFLIEALAGEEAVKDIADRQLSSLRIKFPQILWSLPCLEALLQLAASSGQLRERLREWVALALLLAPATAQGLVQEVLRKGSVAKTTALVALLATSRVGGNGEGPPPGWPPATPVSQVLAGTAAAAAAAGRDMEGGGGILGTSIASANMKAKYAGEVEGTLQARDGDGDGGGKWSALADKLVGRLQALISAAQQGTAVSEEEFREASLRAAALLLHEGGHTHHLLLQVLCWAPPKMGTCSAMVTGVYTWTWLLAARPRLRVPLMAEMADAWMWTVEERGGLFGREGGPRAQLRPHLESGEPEDAPAVDPGEGIAAHGAWLRFLLDQYEVSRHSSSECMALIGRLLHGSLLHSEAISRHPAANGAALSLLLLALQYAVGQVAHCRPHARAGLRLLRDRVHRAALARFAAAPLWFECDGKEGRALEAFMRALKLEERVENQFGAGTGAGAGGGRGDGPHPVWASGSMDEVGARRRRRQLLLLLLEQQADRVDVWTNPLNPSRPVRVKSSGVSSEVWKQHVGTAWEVDPRIAVFMGTRFPGSLTLRTHIAARVKADVCGSLYNTPEALPYFVTPAAAADDSPLLHHLPYFGPCSITAALELLTPAYKGHPRVMAYVLRVLETYPPERVTAFMPQLVQALRYDHRGLVEGYLMLAAQQSYLFSHILIWQLQGEFAPSSEEAKESEEGGGGEGENVLFQIVPRVRQRVIDNFSAEARGAFEREFKFFDAVTSISATLKPIPKSDRRAAIRPELEKIPVEGEDLYLPTDPTQLVRAIVVDSGRPLQSAKKVPIMVSFVVEGVGGERSAEEEGEGEGRGRSVQRCIFKVGDDCRQDVLALQVIKLLRDLNSAAGIALRLFPYGVLPTGFERGIIEVVPNARSRSEIGEVTDVGLYDIFQQQFGAVGSPPLEAARDAFIGSCAGYAVASLVLQPKDRHNGNLLIDREGHLVHIDFGFILETSPGGNMRFESANFKLSHEMTQILDPSGGMRSEPWQRFVSLCVKGYLVARQHMEAIINTVLLMADSGLPCFGRGDPIGNLRKRFHAEMSEREAANFMIAVCTDAYNKWTTAGYDLIQYLQQGIEK